MFVKSQEAVPQTAQFPLSFLEFVSLVALLMALTALSIDVMLPALPQIGNALGVSDENDRQLVISVYFIGFAAGQFLFGPLSDHYGRRQPLLAGLALYIAGTIIALSSGSFAGLLAARVFQGFGASAPRVIALAIVRDRFGGREMARVMSFVMMVFIVVPILAPGVGEIILQISSWRIIFHLLLFVAASSMIWAWFRLPETRRDEDRLPFSLASVWQATKLVATTRQTAGYMIGMGFVFGLLLSYIVSAQQIFVDVYGLGSRFPVAFGAISCFLIAASGLNALFVRKIGMRGVSHRAIFAGLAVCGLMALAGFPAMPPLLLFGAFMGIVFFCFGVIMPNFSALSMEPMSHIAGTASSLAGFYSTVAGAAFGTAIGRSFDGTVRPLCIGVTALLVATLITVLITERFKLMQHKAPPDVHLPGAE
ncbi:MAG TPA: multidrug effflux MFS transporter [Rhodomicrobium sp.]|nr:multidrug effflux MFS transporter [Rhodomicrobium sp.]